MKLPFKGTYAISQNFGENNLGFYKADGLKGHTGTDFLCPTGTPLISPINGVVVVVSNDIARGEGVAIISTDLYKYKGQDCFLDVVLWHMMDKSIKVKVGQTVKVGDLLGLSDNTGRSTGPHLHLTIVPLAPDGSRRPLEGNDNGYNGAVDPLLFLDFPEKLVEFSHTWKLPVSKVKEFQSKHGLVPDGKVGPLTQSEIEKLI